MRRVLTLAAVAALGGCGDIVAPLLPWPANAITHGAGAAVDVFGLPELPPPDRNAPVDQFTDFYWCRESGYPRVRDFGRQPCPSGYTRIPFAEFKRQRDAEAAGTVYCYDPVYRVRYTLERQACRPPDRQVTRDEYERLS